MHSHSEFVPANWTAGEKKKKSCTWEMILCTMKGALPEFLCLFFRWKRRDLSGIFCWYVIQEVLWLTVSPKGYAIIVPRWKTTLTLWFCPWTICIIRTVTHFINSELLLEYNSIAYRPLPNQIGYVVIQFSTYKLPSQIKLWGFKKVNCSTFEETKATN